MTLVQDKQVLQRTDIDYMYRKPSVRGGLESGLEEERLELIINKNLTPEKMQSIIRFAALRKSSDCS